MNGSSPSAVAAPRAADPRPARSTGRRGVTLVELMVVMVILSILASLTLSGLAVARTRARETKTMTTIRKLSEVILPFYEEYETRRPQLDALAVARISASGDRKNREQLAGYKRIALRRLMALELPDRVSDIFPTGQPDISAPLPTSDPRVDGQSTPLVEVPPVTRRYRSLVSGADNVTSADLLHLIVTRGVVADPDMNAHFREDEMKDTNGNGLKEFVDGWGNPIMFQRWPVGFASPLQPVTGSLTDVEPLVSTRGHRLVPLIFSAGRDGSYDIMVNAPPGADEWRSAATLEPYDPFDASLRAAAGAGQQPLKGEVFLIPSAEGGVETFVAVRFDGSGLPAGAFQTAGSPRDTGSRETGTPDGKLQSADNIHNHDLRQ